MASSQDAWYLSLLGLAENFRTSSPPNIKLCIQCLQAVFHFKPPPRVEARTHLQLGNILLTHTKNTDLARNHLEQAWCLSQMINAFDDVKFEAASVLAELYEQQAQSNLSKPILRKAIELSQHSVYWHCRLIFQLAQIHASEKDYELASSLLGVGVDYAHISAANYTRVLFLLSRAMLLLIEKKIMEVHPLLNQAGHLVDNWQGSPHQKEYLKVFFLVLQVYHYLMSGQVKSVKPCLKQLQQSIQTIMLPTWPSDEIVSGSNVGDMFVWMPKEHLYVLVYLVTVMHSMQAGYMDKAQKYTDKALTQIDKLKIVDNKPILSVFQLILLEHIIMCHLVMGNKSLALQEISQACGLCHQHPKLLEAHRPQLHTLLGLYAMNMNCMEAAEAQFHAALRTSTERELWTFANLNLAIVYLRAKREQEFDALFERINPETLPSHSHSLRAAAYYVQGLQSFFQAKYNEAKRYLRETLKMANAEDLNRLTSCSLVLLGHIFLSLGNSRESMNMVTPAMQLASKIPDVHVQLWASAILKDLFRLCGDPGRENEAFQMHCNFSQMLLKDHFQSTQMSEHNLIHWTEGNFPMLLNSSPTLFYRFFLMNPTETPDVCLKRKKNGETDFKYSSNKKPRLDKPDEDEGDSKNEIKEVKTLKQGSSSVKNFGKAYMLKLGYVEGSGLGKHQNGIVQPVEASKQRGRRGFGFEPTDLKDAVSKYDPNLEEILVDEEVEWLTNDPPVLSKKCLESWVTVGSPKKSVDANSQFCDHDIINDILSSKNVLNTITAKDLENGRGRSNPFESIHNAIFLNRAAMKMANLDAILDWMFTEPKDIYGKKVIQPNELLYFADVCAGPGGFSEYVLFRKKWRAKGFGFTLRRENDFLLDQFWAGPPESFEPHYGVKEDGNVYAPENIQSFKEHVLKHTDGKGVHFMMADGGVHIDEKFNDQELICKKLYLCQCLVALLVVRTEGHFVVKLFDIFTEFSVGLIYLMYRSFREISIIKPNTSRPANSERYLVCKWKRENSRDIGEHLFEINKRIPEYNEKQDTFVEDVLELVPTHILINDEKFYNYILKSNNRLGKRQVLSLIKLAAYSEKIDLQEERQQELRKICLKKWNIPDEARAEPKKCDARAKWMELLGNSSLCNLEYDLRKSTLPNFGVFKQTFFSKYSWHCLVLSGEENNSTCAFYLGLGRKQIHKYASGKWTNLSGSCLCLPANTLVYGEIVNEYLGSGKSQRKISAFHIIDGLFLGNEDIRRLPYKERLNICGLFAKSLYKETCPVRVKTNYLLPDICKLRERLVLNSTKSSSLKSQCVRLEADSFFKAGGIMFIRDTRGTWHRHISKSTNRFYLYNAETHESVYEGEIKSGPLTKEYYGDFEYSFRTKLIWWWDDQIIQDRQSYPDSNKLQWENITNFLNGP